VVGTLPQVVSSIVEDLDTLCSLAPSEGEFPFLLFISPSMDI
jgi:hypothetical protein